MLIAKLHFSKKYKTLPVKQPVLVDIGHRYSRSYIQAPIFLNNCKLQIFKHFELIL